MLQAEFIEQKEKIDVVQVETLDHLGIVAGLVDRLMLVKRIDALIMVMTLCLMVYNAGQYQVRKELEMQQQSILSQVGKPTKKPTLRCIFKKVSGLHRFHIPGQASFIRGWIKKKKRPSTYLARKFVECIDWFSLSQENAVLFIRQVWRP